MGELDNERGEELDHDVRHLHRAHGEGHHTLFGTAVNEAGLQALNQLSLQREQEKCLMPAQLCKLSVRVF